MEEERKISKIGDKKSHIKAVRKKGNEDLEASEAINAEEER